jgi:hypothetical protein
LGDDLTINFPPHVFPFGGAANELDFQTLLPENHRNYEERVKEMLDSGIEADTILIARFSVNMERKD